MSNLYDELFEHLKAQRTASEGSKDLFSDITTSFGPMGDTSYMDAALSNESVTSKLAVQDIQEMLPGAETLTFKSWPPKSGTRVAFKGDLQSLIAYPNPPSKGEQGTVVKVRLSTGDQTTKDKLAFIQWDNGTFMPAYKDHLVRPSKARKTASFVRIATHSLGDLTSFFAQVGSGSDLVHKSSRDLWALEKEGDQYVLSRLFDGDGNPIKG